MNPTNISPEEMTILARSTSLDGLDAEVRILIKYGYLPVGEIFFGENKLYNLFLVKTLEEQV